MRLPRFPDPEELPLSVEVRTFSGDLVKVYRPRPVAGDVQRKAYLAVLLVLVVIALGTAGSYGQAPFGIVELAPVAAWFRSSFPTCRAGWDCNVQLGLVLITIFAAVKLGFWMLWQVALMRYAATVEDETQ